MGENRFDWDKPFEAFLESGAVLNARLLSSDYKYSGLTLRVVQVERGANSSSVHTYHENGAPRYGGDAPPLRNKTRKVEKWYNVYRSYPGSTYFSSREEAARQAARSLSPLLETRSIEIEEPA
jgi:hypothetical protein